MCTRILVRGRAPSTVELKLGGGGKMEEGGRLVASEE